MTNKRVEQCGCHNGYKRIDENYSEQIIEHCLLHAAAPELLEAIKYVQPHLREYVEYHQKRSGCSVEMEQALELIEHAIAKAQEPCLEP